MESFKNALKQHFRFTEQECDTTITFYTPETLAAKKHLVKQGQISTKLAVVKSGLLRSYTIDTNNREVTLQFYKPGMVVFSADSFNKGLPAQESIYAYTDCELLTITKPQFEELYKQIPKWQSVCLMVADIKNKEFQNRARQFQTLTAAQRYETFCNDHADILLQAPLGHIASYLGMDIATLSRLRNKR